MGAFLETVVSKYNVMRARHFSNGYEGVTHAGIALVALDTGRVFLAKRAYDASDDEDVRETWEFPGGGLKDGEEPYPGAARELIEETGWGLPDDATVEGGWRSDDGVYQGFLVSTAVEFAVDEWSPTTEVADIGWFDRVAIQSLSDIGALRPEVRDQTDWDMIFGVSRNREGDMPESDEALTAAQVGTADEYMQVDADEPDADEPDDLDVSDLTGPIQVHGVIAPEALQSGDRRGFAENALTRREGPRLPLRHQKADLPGHQGAVTVGSIDRMMRKGGLIHWEGTLLDTDEAEEFIGLLCHFGRYGLSLDGDKTLLDEKRLKEEGVAWYDTTRISGATACAIPAFAEAYVALGPHPDMPAGDTDEAMSAAGIEAGDFVEFKRGPGWVTNPVETRRLHRYWTQKGQPGYAKIRWGTNGDFTRCTKLVGEKIAKNSPEDMRFLKRICAQWHKDALGYWPGELGKPGNAPDTKENRRRAAIHAASGEQGWEKVSDEELMKRSEAIDAELDAVVESVEGLSVVEDGDAEWEAVLVSSARAGARPPLSYFHRQETTDALVIEDPDENGFRHTYGYAAEWGVCHVGMEGRCVEPPRTGSDDYPEFHLGRTRVDTGEGEGYVYTGLLTYGVGHRDAQTILSESPTQQHFDNIKNAWAAVRVGEDERGIWFSGVVLPKVDEDDITLIQASGQVSGEWKHGAMRAALTVNVPGFPVERSSAEYDAQGNVVALAASAFGGVPDAPCNESDDPVGEVALAVMERIEARARMQALKQDEAMRRFSALKTGWEN